MANFVFNIAKGRVVELYNRVDLNDPANSAIVVVAINANGVSDATMQDLDDLAAVLATAVNEVTNVNYARKVLTDADLAAIAVDDANDRFPLDTGDLTWGPPGPAAGDAWTDLLWCYDADTTAGTDANIIPMVCSDFVATPDGSDIVAQVADFFRAT